MNSSIEKLNWRIGFCAFCLVYAVWIVYLGFENFDKVHREFHMADERLHPERIEQIALQELAVKCRQRIRRDEKRIDRYREMKDRTALDELDPCLSWPQAVLIEKQKNIAERLTVERDRLKRRVVTFYISFGFFFLLLPMAALYMFISLLALVFRNMKFSK